ncbi:serine/threonine-protein kinase PrkC [bacterium BMS3Abin07]|nr:serine/threonine-protein kinase PrkC [bacterium BMS3Abin07]GBE32065.1 serine/threonine-protein kinase PrkC [bacterium BMS3Bbin05]HDO21530.1 PASTA domain-containing protein [Nitrospirota bacterium]
MKKLLKAILYFIIFSFTGIAIAYLTFYMLSTTKSYEVPSLVGKSLLDANKILSDKNLYLKIDGESYDADVPSGHIMKQNIPSGQLIKAGRRIGVIISKGPRILYTPMFAGLSIDDAEKIAEENHIKIDRIIKVHSDSIEKNMVIAQDPNPEEHGAGGLSLIVSIGNYDNYLICPSFIDMKVEKARELARKLGLDVSISGSGDTIDTQRPVAYSLVKSGDNITLDLKEGRASKWWF